MTPAPEGWDARVGAELAAIRAAGRWRDVRELDATGPVTGTVDGRTVVVFASNDYLGLSHHPAVVAAGKAALDRWGAGSGASRLVVGSRPGHRALEDDLADWTACDAALLFPTGFAANLGVLATLGGQGATILSDELNHASIVDGARLARAEVRIYRHADLDHLAKLLVDVEAAGRGPALVVSDSVFSMDGDLADVDGLVDVCAGRDALVVLDEAHAVLGPAVDPARARERGVPVLRVGTLSKALGSLGGFVAGPRPYVDLLRNRARPFIFTTAPTPADTAAARAALAVVRSPEGEALVGRLRANVQRLRPGHPSPIVPVILGAEQAALAASASLAADGLLVPAIRPPTVAPGTSRLRVALSAAHTADQVERLAAALSGLAAVAPYPVPDGPPA